MDVPGMTTRHGDLQPMTVSAPRSARLIIVAAIVIPLIFIGLTAVSLWKARDDGWRGTERTGDNLRVTISRDVQRYFEIHSILLQDVAEDLKEPGVSQERAAHYRFLSRAVELAHYPGSMLILDVDGNIAADSAGPTPRTANFADRDYFQVHKDGRHEGLYFSRPFRSRLRDGDPSIALSLRVEDDQGRFAGVLMTAVSLSYIRALFADLDTNPQDTLVLMRDDGLVLVRDPPLEGGNDLGFDLSGSESYRTFVEGKARSAIGIGRIDGVERYFTYEHVLGFPLIVAIGLSVHEALADWRLRAFSIGGLTLVLCAMIVGISIALYREIVRRAQVEADLAFLSITDGLTGIANRRRFDEIISLEWQRGGRTGASLALLFIDADQFKNFNDRYGHARGDEVLKAIARTIDACLQRPNDIAARFGGEEFAAILPDTDVGGAQQIAERIRASIADGQEAGLVGLGVTVSIGVAAMHASGNLHVKDLVAAADHALYRAKDQGRNRVVVDNGEEEAGPPRATADPRGDPPPPGGGGPA